MRLGLAAWRRGLAAWLDELRRFDWGELGDHESIGSWPRPVKLLLGLLLFAVLLAAGYWFKLKGVQENLWRLERAEVTLRDELQAKAGLASDLPGYRRQLQEMEATFGELLRQLPEQSEVPSLLEDVSTTGLGNGLEFGSIQVQDELTRAFYIELPIRLELWGDYHAFGAFVSALASLPRIVTLHDFSIEHGGDARLKMQITARTYRYRVDEAS